MDNPQPNYMEEDEEDGEHPEPTTITTSDAAIIRPPHNSNKTETEPSEDLSDSLKSQENDAEIEDNNNDNNQDEEDLHPKKRKSLSSLTTPTPTVAEPEPDPAQAQLPQPVPEPNDAPAQPKKSKKKNNNVWVTKSTRKGKKKTKPNTNNNNVPREDKALDSSLHSLHTSQLSLTLLDPIFVLFTALDPPHSLSLYPISLYKSGDVLGSFSLYTQTQFTVYFRQNPGPLLALISAVGFASYSQPYPLPPHKSQSLSLSSIQYVYPLQLDPSSENATETSLAATQNPDFEASYQGMPSKKVSRVERGKKGWSE